LNSFSQENFKFGGKGSQETSTKVAQKTTSKVEPNDDVTGMKNQQTCPNVVKIPL
jgi:hypothetical protein